VNNDKWVQLIGNQLDNTIDTMEVQQYGDIVEYDDKIACIAPGTVVEYSGDLPPSGIRSVSMPKQPSTWRRFIMWFKDKRIEKLEAEVRRLTMKVGEAASSDFYSWCGEAPLDSQVKNMRRDIDLLLKKHKLCVSHSTAKVSLVKCKK